IICTGIDPHLIHSIFLFFIYRIIYRKKFLWWSHATYGKQGYLGFLFRKIIYKTSSGILVYSQKGLENLLQMNVPQDKICVVNNSINKNEYGYLNCNLSKDANNAQKIILLFCGRVTKSKKIDILIE